MRAARGGQQGRRVLAKGNLHMRDHDPHWVRTTRFSGAPCAGSTGPICRQGSGITSHLSPHQGSCRAVVCHGPAMWGCPWEAPAETPAAPTCFPLCSAPGVSPSGLFCGASRLWCAFHPPGVRAPGTHPRLTGSTSRGEAQSRDPSDAPPPTPRLWVEGLAEGRPPRAGATRESPAPPLAWHREGAEGTGGLCSLNPWKPTPTLGSLQGLRGLKAVGSCSRRVRWTPKLDLGPGSGMSGRGGGGGGL